MDSYKYNNLILRIENTSEDNIPFLLEIPLYLTTSSINPIELYSNVYAYSKLSLTSSVIYSDFYTKKNTLAKYKKNFYDKARKEKEEKKNKKIESLTNNQLNTKDLLMFYKSNLDKLDFNNRFFSSIDDMINDSFDINDESNIELINELNKICSCLTDYINYSKELVAIQEE